MSVLQMLNILEGYEMAEFGFGSLEHVHYFTEAKKLAYADLAAWYGDPDFTVLPVAELLSKEYAAERRRLIQDERAGSYGPGLEGGRHTSYLTVGGGGGKMVSLRQNKTWRFGSGFAPPDPRLPLQN